MCDKGKNGDGKVNNSQVAISLAAFLCFSERARESESERASERADVEERVRREPRARRAAAGASERKSVRYEGEKPRLERK